MAETTKRSTNNSASKSRKSRTDIIRTTLGMYLKQKNYTVSDVCVDARVAHPPTMVGSASGLCACTLWIIRSFVCLPENCEQFLWINRANRTLTSNEIQNNPNTICLIPFCPLQSAHGEPGACLWMCDVMGSSFRRNSENQI